MAEIRTHFVDAQMEACCRIAMPPPVIEFRSAPTSMKSSGVASSKPQSDLDIQLAFGRSERAESWPASPASGPARMRAAYTRVSRTVLFGA